MGEVVIIGSRICVGTNIPQMIDLVFLLLLILLLILIALWFLALYGVNQWTRPARVSAQAHPRDFGLPWEDVEFTSRDGVKLRGWFIPPPPPATSAVIFCHGHGGNKDPDLIYVPWFFECSIPVLLFDFRNHGLSDGTLTSMGFYEREDLLGAVDYLVSRGFTRIGLFGFSMGGAIAIATAPLSEQIVCVVADSPFAQLQPTLVMGMCARGFPRWFAKVFVRLISWMGARRLKCDPREADPVRAVQHFGQRPLLVILGEHDEYIEPWQGQLLYDKASGPKEFWLVPGISHRDVSRYRPELYREKVMGFFERWLTKNLRRVLSPMPDQT